MSRRVVITGVGPVSSIGIGRSKLVEAFQRGQSSRQTVRWLDDTRLAGFEYSQIPPFSVSDFLPSKLRKSAKLMSRDTQLGVVSSVLAMQDADLFGDTAYDRHRCGCFSGAGNVSVEQSDLAPALVDCSLASESSLKRWGEHSMSLLPPLMVLKYLPNMIGSHISILHQLKGISNTINCGEPGGHLAIGEAYHAIRRGTCDMAICGGAESRINETDLIYEIAKRQIHKRSERTNWSTAVPSEGAGFVVLESLEAAMQRQAPILAEITAFAVRQSVANERVASRTSLSSRGLSRAILAALRGAGLSPEELDAALCSGCGIAEDCESEEACVRALFDETTKFRLLNTRLLFGNCYAGNSLDICVSALLVSGAIDAHQLPSNICSFENTKPQQRDMRHVMATSNNAEGQNVAIILSRLQ